MTNKCPFLNANVYFVFACTLSFSNAFKKHLQGFPGGAVVENPPANAGDAGSSPGLGRSHMLRSNWAREPQLLSLRVWSLCSQQERPRQWEAHAPRWRVTPACRNWRKPLHRSEDPTQSKKSYTVTSQKSGDHLWLLSLPHSLILSQSRKSVRSTAVRCST